MIIECEDIERMISLSSSPPCSSNDLRLASNILRGTEEYDGVKVWHVVAMNVVNVIRDDHKIFVRSLIEVSSR